MSKTVINLQIDERVSETVTIERMNQVDENVYRYKVKSKILDEEFDIYFDRRGGMYALLRDVAIRLREYDTNDGPRCVYEG